MALVGLKNFYYSGMIKDGDSIADDAYQTIVGSDTKIAYGTTKRIIGINSVDINPTVNDATLYGDDAALATASSLGEIEVTIGLANLPLEDAAFLLGNTLTTDTKILQSSASDKAPYVAIMFESEKHDGKNRYVKLLKGRFSVSQETINTKGDSVEFQLPQITGKFVAREYDKMWKLTHDETGANDTTATNWYNYVEGSDTTFTDTTITKFLGQ